MNTVKRLKTSSLQLSPKKRFSFKSQLSILLLASLTGTYLDLFFVGKGLYSFPKRLFSDVFTINIVFTIFILPIFTYILILIVKNMSPLSRWTLFFITSLLIAGVERLSEQYGFFIHSEQWKHTYSFWGYLFYMLVMWRFHKWVN